MLRRKKSKTADNNLDLLLHNFGEGAKTSISSTCILKDGKLYLECTILNLWVDVLFTHLVF